MAFVVYRAQLKVQVHLCKPCLRFTCRLSYQHGARATIVADAVRGDC